MRRSDSGRWLDTHLVTVVAAAGALPALRVPGVWLLLCAAVAAVLVGVSSVRGRAATTGTADLVVLPGRVAGRLALGCLNPINWLKVLLGALASLAVGAVAGALIAAARWLAVEGPDGILAAARLGAWAHAPRYGAAFACYLLLSGVGRTHDQRVAALYRRTRRLREVALVALTAVVVGAFAMVTLAGPASDVGFARADDGLGWVPPGLRTVTDGLRDDMVKAELDGVTRLSERRRRGALDRRVHRGQLARRARRRDVDRRSGACARPAVDRGGGARRAQPARAVGGGDPDHGGARRRAPRRPPRAAHRRADHRRQHPARTLARRTAMAVDDRTRRRHRSSAHLLRPHAVLGAEVPARPPGVTASRSETGGRSVAGMTDEVHHHPIPRSWHDAEVQTEEFQALLRQYDNDYQKAVDAWKRGEVGDPKQGGNANPM